LYRTAGEGQYKWLCHSVAVIVIVQPSPDRRSLDGNLLLHHFGHGGATTIDHIGISNIGCEIEHQKVALTPLHGVAVQEEELLVEAKPSKQPQIQSLVELMKL
jgi:hypothetical protein